MVHQSLLDQVQDLLAVGGDRVIVIAGGGVLQQGGLAAGDIIQKPLHVQAGADVQLAADHAVSPVVYEDVLDAAAQIHAESQLPGRILIRMIGFEDPAAESGILQQIAAGSSLDVFAVGPQQGDVLYDDLPADPETGSQLTGRDGAAGSLELLQYFFSSLNSLLVWFQIVPSSEALWQRVQILQ